MEGPNQEEEKKLATKKAGTQPCANATPRVRSARRRRTDVVCYKEKMIIFEIIGEFIIGIVFEGIVLGTFRRVRRVWNDLKRKIFNLPNSDLDLISKFEKEVLYKDIITTTDINPKIPAGIKGCILEIINPQKVFAEFYDENGSQIEYEGEIVFEVDIDRLKIMK